MTEIKKGEYVRTKKGIIFKADQNFYLHNDIPLKFATFSDRVISHNVEILEIINPGDYVNGEKIVDIQKEYYDVNLDKVLPLKIPKIIVGNEEGVLSVDKILTVATKEQFEGIEYRLED